jgi:hypothetical protein
MIKKFLGTSLIVSSLMLIAGCSEQPATGPEQTTTLNPQSGKFGLSSMGKLEKRSADAAVLAGSQVTFNLGKIKGSSGFFFLLYNVGMTPITNVTLSIENPAYSVFPSSMDTLIPGSDVGMLPVVKIAAFHGTPYDGVGTRPLLPMGNNKFVLHISGNSKTTAGKDTVIALDAEMNLDALIMDLSINGMNGKLTPAPEGGVNTSEVASIESGITKVSNYSTKCKGDSIITIRNAGNVPLHCKIYSSSNITATNNYTVVKVADTVIASGSEMKQSIYSSDNSQAYYLVASGENAVVDPATLRLNDNGTYCARIAVGTGECSTVQTEARFNAYLAAHEQDQCGKKWALIDNRLLIYGQNYRNGDSLSFVLYDLVNDEQLSSYTGKNSTLIQDNCYKGVYLSMFTNAIAAMLMGNDKDPKLFGGYSYSGGSSNWVTTTEVSLTPCYDGQPPRGNQN